MRGLLLTIVTVMLASGAAQAQGEDCRPVDGTNVTWDDGTPLSGLTVLVCRDRDGLVRTARSFTAPHHDDNGACVVLMNDIVLEERHGHLVAGERAGFPHPSLLAQHHDGPCPPVGADDGYVLADGVPDGVFAALNQVWDGMRANPHGIGRLMAESTALDGEASRELAYDLGELAGDLGNRQLVLVRIMPARGAGWHDRAYRLVVRDRRDWDAWREIEVDWIGEGWRIVGLRRSTM